MNHPEAELRGILLIKFLLSGQLLSKLRRIGIIKITGSAKKVDK